jgi:hypothetical protein
MQLRPFGNGVFCWLMVLTFSGTIFAQDLPDFLLDDSPGFDAYLPGSSWEPSGFSSPGGGARSGSGWLDPFTGHRGGREPFGAERASTEDDLLLVPEPLLFDMVRPLGARKGELEFNTLAVFPWSSRRHNGETGGISPSATEDRGGIEWAPEVEFAPIDNFAIEFEYPFEHATLESYKVGLQYTIGTAFNHQYIHGFQVLVEPTTDWRDWNTTLLYIGGMRFSETWSGLFMIGGRVDLEGPNSGESFENLLNLAIFKDISHSMSIGLESNYSSHTSCSKEIVLVPQVQYEVTDHFQMQAGLGFGFAEQASEQAFILRVIWSN